MNKRSPEDVKTIVQKVVVKRVDKRPVQFKITETHGVWRSQRRTNMNVVQTENVPLESQNFRSLGAFAYSLKVMHFALSKPIEKLLENA